MLAATKNSFVAHQLGELSGNFADWSDSALFNIVGGAAFAAGRHFRKTGDLLFLSPGSVRQRVAMEKDRDRSHGEPQLRRGIRCSDHLKTLPRRAAWIEQPRRR